MTPHQSVNSLIAAWLAEREEGREASPDSMCAKYPHWSAQIRQKIRRIEEVEAAVRGALWTPSFPEIAGYEIRRVLGEGGMGIVYEAVEHRLGRPVAIKLANAERLSASERHRFQLEAESAAKVVHPNVVELYAYGEVNGKPYLVLECVRGGTLKEKLNNGALAPVIAAGLVCTLAAAVERCHQMQVLHRDLKPGNILFTEAGIPKISDFGLAKQVSADCDLTLAGRAIGSPAYMAPEQAHGAVKEIGTLCDVYGLGAILYHVLTGHPPFEGLSAEEIVEKVKTEAPLPVRHRNPCVPADLAVICQKCLEQCPTDRYPTASAVADDLRRFLANESILARRDGLLERLNKWRKRRPAAATVVAVSTAALVVTLGMLGYSLTERYSRLTTELDTSQKLTDSKNREIVVERRRVEEVTEAEKKTRAMVVAMASEEGKRFLDRGEYGPAMLWDAKALELDRDNPRSQLMHRLRLTLTSQQVGSIQFLRHFPKPPRFIAIHPAGDRLATLTDNGCDYWDLATQPPLARMHLETAGPLRRVVFSPDGSLLAVMGAEVTLWDGRTGKRVGESYRHEGVSTTATFSADGSSLITWGDDRFIRVWDMKTGRPVGQPLRQAREIFKVDTVPGSTCILVHTESAVSPLHADIRLWDLSAHKEIDLSKAFNRTEENTPGLIAFSGNGRRFVTVSGLFPKTRMLIWDAEKLTSKQVPLATDPLGTPRSVALNHDGSRVALCRGLLSTQTDVFDLDSNPNVSQRRITLEDTDVETVEFSSDGQALLLRAQNAKVKIMDAVSGNPCASPVYHPSKLTQSVYTKNGTHIAATCENGIVMVWRSRDSRLETRILREDHNVYTTALSNDGHWLAVGSVKNSVSLWDLAKKERFALTQVHTGPIYDVAFRPDGQCLVTGSLDGTARLWNLRDRDALPAVLRHDQPVRLARFTSDGKRILTLSYGNDGEMSELRLWSADPPKLLARYRVEGEQLHEAFLSPTDSTIITVTETVKPGQADKKKTVWLVRFHDPTTLAPLFAPLTYENSVKHIAFRPDGVHFVICAGEKTAQVWNVVSGEAVGQPLLHETNVEFAVYSKDGKHLVTASGGYGLGRTYQRAAVRLWDADTLQPLSRPIPVAGPRVNRVHFILGGQGVAVASGRPDPFGVDSGTISLIDLRTEGTLGPPLSPESFPYESHVLPDGENLTWVCAAPKSKAVWVWNINSLQWEDTRYSAFANLITGKRIDESGAIISLVPSELVSLWETYLSQGQQ